MWNSVVVVLLASIAQSTARNEIGLSDENTVNSMLVNKLQKDLPPRPRTDFDGTMLGKSGHMLTPSRTTPSLRLSLPPRHRQHPMTVNPRYLPPTGAHAPFMGKTVRGLSLQAAAGKSLNDALSVSMEMQKEMMGTEFQGSSKDKTVGVVFSGGSLVPLKCDVTPAAIDLGRAALSQSILEAMQDAHTQSVSATKKTMQDITSKLGIPPPGGEEECSLESKELACKMQQEVEGLEYTGSSEDQTVGVVFNGNLAPVKCDISEAAMALGPEAVSQNVLEAMAGAYGRAVAGMSALMGAVPPMSVDSPTVFERS